MEKFTGLNYQFLSFDHKLSEKRMLRAKFIFGEKILINILCLSLYLLGIKRNSIASLFDISPNTIRVKIRTFLSDGISSLIDRREKNLARQIKRYSIDNSNHSKISLKINQNKINISIGDISINIPKKNNLQARTMILTLVENKLITKTIAAKILNLTSAHVGYLCNEIKTKDIHCLIDQRKGLQHDYKFTPEVKAELIQEFTVNNLIGKSASGKTIAKKLESIFETSFSQRTVRFHMLKLGLTRIKNTLQKKYEAEKKNFVK